jgi:hypothetical protein
LKEKSLEIPVPVKIENLANLSEQDKPDENTGIPGEIEPEFEEEEPEVQAPEDEEDGYDAFLKRKLPQKGAPKKVIGGKKRG